MTALGVCARCRGVMLYTKPVGALCGTCEGIEGQRNSQGPEDPALDIEDKTGRTPRERMEA